MKLDEKIKAIELREKGYSLREISVSLNVAKSSVSSWVRGVKLSDLAKERLQNIQTEREQKISQTLSKRRLDRIALAKSEASNFLQGINSSSGNKKLLCAMLYWCEGAKGDNRVDFTNSDPNLINLFLNLFRSEFYINESKFRPIIHLHEYHNKNKQLNFWSKITKIPSDQFTEPYIKPNTGKRIRANYQGCVTIRYHSSHHARVLLEIAKQYMGTKNQGL